MTRTKKWNVCAIAVLLPTLICAAAACAPAQVPPDVTVTCIPKSITIEVRNVSDTPASYTVVVEINRAGLVETERYSSNRVQPGESVTLNDDRPDDEESCKIAHVEVYS